MAFRVGAHRHIAALLVAVVAIGCGGSTDEASAEKDSGYSPDASLDAAPGDAGVDSDAASNPDSAPGDGATDADAAVTNPPGCVGAWSPITGALSPRSNHGAAWTGSEVLIWGGAKIQQGWWPPPELDDGARFDPKTGVFVMLPKTGTPQQGSFVAWHAGELVVLGGWQQKGDMPGPAVSQEGFHMNLATNAVVPIPSPAGATALQYPTLAGNELLVAAYPTQSWCRFSFAQSSWACSAEPAYFAGIPGGWIGLSAPAVVVGNDIYVWALVTGDASAPVSVAARYSLQTHTWSLLPKLGAPETRHGPMVEWLGDRLLVCGGNSLEKPVTHFLTGGFYHPATDSWSAMAPTPNFDFCSSIVRAGDRLLFWNHDKALGAVYDLATSSWTELCRVNAMPPMNNGASMNWTGSELIVLGGKASGTVIGARLKLPP